MSRLGKNPIEIPSSITVTKKDSILEVKGAKGTLEQKIHPRVIIDIKEKELQVSVKDENLTNDRALWGLYASLIRNMIKGVTEGYEKKLEIVGVGYKASASGNKLNLNIGFSHTVEYQIPDGIIGTVEKNIISISGIDKQQVGQVAAKVRSFKKPEPYKGKGIRYVGEIIIRKAGKAAKKSE